MEQIQERRSFPRFHVKDLTLAINKKVFGPVIDISLGGLAFEYYDNDFNEAVHSTLGIYHMTSGVLISGVLYKIIRNNIIKHEASIMPIIKKRCAVQFQEASYEQQDLLRSFIDQHTSTCGPKRTRLA